MTREEFIQILNEKGYSYNLEGNKIVVTYGGYVNLSSLETLPLGVVFKGEKSVDLESLKTLPPDAEFRNGKDVLLGSLKTIPPGVVFDNGSSVWLRSLYGGWFKDWSGNIEGISSKILLNKMIKNGVFYR